MIKVIYNFHASTKDSWILNQNIELIEKVLDKPEENICVLHSVSLKMLCSWNWDPETKCYRKVTTK